MKFCIGYLNETWLKDEKEKNLDLPPILICGTHLQCGLKKKNRPQKQIPPKSTWPPLTLCKVGTSFYKEQHKTKNERSFGVAPACPGHAGCGMRSSGYVTSLTHLREHEYHNSTCRRQCQGQPPQSVRGEANLDLQVLNIALGLSI